MQRLRKQFRCLNILSSSFYWNTTCSPPLVGGEHEFTSHQISFGPFFTATTRTSTEHARSHENSSTDSSGTTADLTNRHREIPLTGFSLISNTLSTMFSTGS